MRVILLLLFTLRAFAADWDGVQRLASLQKLEILTRSGEVRAEFVSASNDALVVRDKSGERSIPRAEIRRVSVKDPSRRIRQGLLWTAVGAGAGAGVGLAACPSCLNEGHGAKFIGPGLAAGAAIGALGFLSAPYRTIYKSK